MTFSIAPAPIAPTVSPEPWSLSARVAQARNLLRHHFGYDEFRPAQRRVVQSVLTGRDTLAILPTGAGKSVCFQIPALMDRGLTVVISPLISLMQDQVDAATARGIAAESLNGTQRPARQEQILDAVAREEVRLLYVAPERLPRLATDLAVRAICPVRLAIDEAHCIAEWGHDFRPSYRAIRRIRAGWGWPQTVALTGTATPEVRELIADSLGLGRGKRTRYDEHVASFDRPNLWFGVIRVKDDRERLRTLVDLLHTDDRIAIVYAPTRNMVEAIVRVLREQGYLADAYHAGLTKDRRHQVLEAFLHDELEVVVATCAFGMGIDKPNVRLVVHWTMPASPESYYQEAGRAGRDGALARCVLLYDRKDAHFAERQLSVTFPDQALAESVWEDPSKRSRVPSRVLASIDRLERELHPGRVSVNWAPVALRLKSAKTRIGVLKSYAESSQCRRATMLRYFGEREGNCAGCDRCRRVPRSRSVDRTVEARITQLRNLLRGRQTAWGGCVLDPSALRNLAQTPPESAEALAARPGVGPVLAERYGGLILRALGVTVDADSDALVDGSRLLAVLVQWRQRVARAMGLPGYVVVGEHVLLAIAAGRPWDRAALAKVPGVGPRFLAKHGAEILSIVTEACSERV